MEALGGWPNLWVSLQRGTKGGGFGGDLAEDGGEFRGQGPS